MKTIKIFKAQDIDNYVKVEDVIIEIKKPFPECNDLSDNLYHHQLNAENLYEALVKHLPGGTIDQLTCMLLKLKAGHLVIPFEIEKENKP